MATALRLDGGPTPYRPLPVVQSVSSARVEAANCEWCRWRDGGDCHHPVQGRPYIGASVFNVNVDGECPHYEPTWWTRVGRRLRIWRSPAMVDPRLWDEKAGGAGR